VDENTPEPVKVEFYGDITAYFIINNDAYLLIDAVRKHAINIYKKSENAHSTLSILVDLITDIENKKVKTSTDHVRGILEIKYSDLEKWWERNYDYDPPTELNFEYLNQLYKKYQPKTGVYNLPKRIKLLLEVLKQLAVLAEELKIDFDPEYMDFSVIDIHELFQTYGKYSSYNRRIWSLSLGDFRRDIWRRVKVDVKPGVSAKRFPETSLRLKKEFSK